MGRFGRAVTLFTLLLAWPQPLPCFAQSSSLLCASPSQGAAGGPGPSGQDLPLPPPTQVPPPASPPTTDPYSAVSPTPQGRAPDVAEELSNPQPSSLSSRPSEKSPLELPPPPGGEVKVDLKPAPLEPGDLRFPINFATALRLSNARPLIIAAAQASAWSAEAQLQKANVLWVPSFMMNVVYLRHDGPVDFNQGINVPQGVNALGQTSLGSFGKPLNQNLNWFYSGASLYQVVALTDVIFQPLFARQELNAARWDIQTARNDALLQTARAYFSVHKFRGQYAGHIYTVEQGRKLIAALEAQRRDLIPAVEVDRARNLLAAMEEKAVSARENWRVASADLTQILRLDPRAVVEPLEHDHLQITLIDPGRSLDELMPIAMNNRPELAAQQALVQAAAVRIRQEKCRPFLPMVLLTGWQTPGGMADQVGIFATGNGGKLNNWSFRDDISTQLVWQWENLGFGNMARVKRQRGVQSEAITTLFQTQDLVASEVNQAQASLQSAAARVVQAERSLRSGLITFNKSLEGLGQTRRFGDVLEQIYRPQEVVYALYLLRVAFDEYFATVAEYNIAQFELFHALGYPAQALDLCRTPGEVLPVETERPSYLPPVGTGPPPPSR